MSPILITATFAIVLIASFSWLYYRLAVATGRPRFSAEWWNHFSVERYRPLERLLDERDFAYLRTIPGYDAGVERRLRSERLRVCRLYLRDMKDDFGRLQAVGQALIVAGRADAGFQEDLFQQKVAFTRAWWLVRIELAGARLGIARVDARRLVATMDATAVKFQPVLTPAA